MAMAQWGPIRINLDEAGFPAASQNLVNPTNPGPIVIGEYDVLTEGVICATGNNYSAGSDGMDDIRVTATLVTAPGLPWSRTEGDFSTISNGSFASDYQIEEDQSRPNDYAYVRYDFEFINGLENSIDATTFNTRHTSTNGSSEGYEWTQVTLNSTPINEANIGNYTNIEYNDLAATLNPDGSYPNGRTMSEFLSAMPAGTRPAGGQVIPGWWAIDDFNTTIFDGVEDPGQGNGGIGDNQTINGANDFGLAGPTLINTISYFFGLTDVGFDVDGDGITGTNSTPSARVTYFDLGSTCAALAICPTIGMLSDPADICQGETFDITASALLAMDVTTNMEADFGINFVSFLGATPPTDPYMGGTTIGTVAFADLENTNTEANLMAAGGMLAAGTYNICAILDQTPADMTCRPAQCIELTVNALPAAPGITGQITFCEGETITPITANGVAGATFQFFADATLTTSAPGMASGAEYTAAITAPGTEQVFITQTDANGCQSPALGITITVNAAPAPPTVMDITVCDGMSTLITPGGGGGGMPMNITVLNEDFETDGNGTRYMTSVPELVATNMSDYFSRTNGSDVNQTYTGPQGTFYFAAQDIDGVAPAPEQTLTISGINITNLTNLQFSLLIAEGQAGNGAEDWDVPDFFHVDYQIDGGGFLPLFWVEDQGATNTEPLVDTNFDGIGDGTAITPTFQTLGNAIAGTGMNLDLRITIRLDAGDEDIAFDLLQVMGTTMGTGPAANNFNFYDADPDMGGILLDGPVAAYDPMTTVATSPQSIFVTEINSFGCEGDAAEVVVTVNANPAAPAFMGETTFCEGEMITPITAMGEAGATFTFYGDAGLTMTAPGTANGAEYTTALTMPGTETVFFTQTNAMGCESAATEVTFEILAAPAAPTFMGDTEFCDGEMITPITAMGEAGATFIFYGDAGLTMTAPGTANGAEYTAALMGPGMETVFFTQTNAMGCESAAAMATITVFANPDPPMVMDVTVCDGEDTEIIPTSATGGGGIVTVYTESFDTAGEGIAGSCPGTPPVDPANCMTNVIPSNGQWTVSTDDASGLVADSDYFQVRNGFLEAQDLDTEVCFLSSMIDISMLSSADFTVDITETGDHEAADYVDVSIAVDGGMFALIPNWMGLGSATHTLIGDQPNDQDWMNTTVTASGFVGASLQVQICVLNNAGSERIRLDNIAVSGISSAGPAYNFYDADPDPGPATLLATGTSYDPMTTVATSPESIFVTTIDPATGCESDAVEVIVTVNPLPTLMVATTDVVDCPGDASGTATATGMGNGPFTFDFSTMNGGGIDGDNDGSQTMLMAGDYSVTVTDNNGCTAEITFVINDAVDNTIPTITCPTGPLDVNCGESTLPAATGIPTSMDDCSDDPVITFTDDLMLDGCDNRTGTLTRTFTATDEAGNTITCVQVINIIDDTPPTFDAPADIAIACTDDPEDLTVTGMATNLADNCGVSPLQNLWINEIHYDNTGGDLNEAIEIAGTAGLNLTGYALILYNGGNNGTVYNTIPLMGMIDDEGNGFGALNFIAPNLQQGPADGIAFVDPDDIVLEFISYEGTFTATNGPALGLTSMDIGVSENGGTPVDFSLQKTGTGNSGGDFTWMPPAAHSRDLLNANQTVTPIVFPVPSFTGFTDVTMGDPNCPNGSTIVRTFTITDACGNTATDTQTITIEDNVAPILPVAPGDLDITVQCPQDIPDAPVLVATDACGGNITATVTSTVVNRECATRFDLVRTFTFDDGCGNISSVEQTIQVIDTDPLLVQPLPDRVVECQVNVMANPALVQSASPCGGDLNVTSEIVGPVGTPDCPGAVYTVVYTVADDCGRSVQTSQRFIIENDGPEFVCPVDICIIECPQNNEMIQTQFDAYADLATVNTSCIGQQVTITNNFSPDRFIEQGCNDGPLAVPGTRRYQIVTFSASTCSGNTSCTAIVAVVDNSPPMLTGTPSIGVAECDDNAQNQFDAFVQSQLSGLNASDVCSVASGDDNNDLIFSSSPTAPNLTCDESGNAVTNVVLTVTDRCGNAASVTTTFIVRNNMPPTLSGLQNRVIQCDDPIQSFSVPVVNNACGTTTVTSVDSRIDGSCPQSFTLIRTFTVTDECGTSSTAEERVIIVDTEAPIAPAAPADVVTTCDNIPAPVTLTATDNCSDNITVSPVDDAASGDCAGQLTIVRTWTFADDCGNMSSVSQNIMVSDDMAPVAPAAPANITVTCANNIPAPVTLTATDNCSGDITVSPTPDIMPGGCDDEFVMVRTWTFVDNCGNMSSVSQTITVNDDVAPVFTFVPTGNSDECMGNPIAFDDAVAEDNCGGMVTITFDDDSNPAGVCGMSVTRTWTATDACGNTATASATMSNGDSQAPTVVSAPSDDIASCGTTPVFGVPVFEDNCDDDITVVMTEETTDGDCDGESVVKRTWTATDDCDNSVIVSQTIILVDNVGPVFVSVPGGNIDCNNGGFDDPVVTDNCSSFVITFVDDTNGMGCAGSVVRTYTATDDCGNVTMATATFTINDNEPPVFTDVPGTPDVDCDEVPDFIEPTAEDNCGNVTLTFVQTESGDLCDLGFARKRVWTATDDCGNTATVETVIWINKDTDAPEFTFVPEGALIRCSDFPPTFGEVEVEDGCSEVTLTFITEFVTGDEDSCDDGESFDYRRVWTATDACGNESTAKQTFWVKPDAAVSATISGSLMDEEHEMVDNVMMSLENPGTGALSQLSEDGTFNFDVIMDQNYALTPERNDDPLNGVTTYDLILLGSHLLEVEVLDSPYKLIAADVNNSGSITSLDMIALRRVILLIDEQFTNNTSWRFVEREYTFADPTNPFASTFPEMSNFNGITQSQIADFMAVKIGDLNASAIPNALAAGDTRSADGALVFQLEEQALVAGQSYEIAFKAQDFTAIKGYQYTLNLGAGLEFIDIEAGALRELNSGNFGLTKMNEGIITTSWNSRQALTVADDEVLFSIMVKATEAVQLSEALQVSSDYTPAEGYSEGSDKLDIALEFGKDGVTIADQFALFQNRPNPFDAETTISFSLPQAQTARLTIYDVSGRVLKVVERDYAAGYNEEQIERSELSGAGVLYYQLETATETATRKMILVNN